MANPTWSDTVPTWEGTVEAKAAVAAPTWDDTTPTWDTTQDIAAPTAPSAGIDFTPALQTVKEIAQVVPALEAGATIVSGGLALPVAGVAGLATAAGKGLGITEADPSAVIQSVADLLTYKPQTKAGEHLATTAMYPIEKLTELSKVAGDKTLEATGSPAAAAAAETAVMALPMAVGARKPGLPPPDLQALASELAPIKSAETTASIRKIEQDMLAQEAAAKAEAAKAGQPAVIESSTIDSLLGVKTPAEIKATTSARRADVEAALKEAGDVPPGELSSMADFLDRTAREVEADRALEASRKDAPFSALDRQREAEMNRGFAAIEEAANGATTPGEMGQLAPQRSPLNVVDPVIPVDTTWSRHTPDAVALTAFKAKQEERLAAAKAATAEKTPEAVEAKAVQADAQRQSAIAELNINPDAPRNKVGDLRTAKFGNAVIDRVRNISPRLATALRRVTGETAVRSSADVKRLDLFYKSPEYKRLSGKDRETLNWAMQNGDGVSIRQVTDKSPGLTELYETNVRGLIDEIGAARRAAGADGFINAFHPRVVKNVAKLRRRMSRADRSKLDDQIAAAADAKGRPLDEFEMGALLNQALGGRPLKTDRSRRINEIPREHMDLYEDSRNAQIAYALRHREDEAIRGFFRENLGQDLAPGQGVTRTTIGDLLAKAHFNGTLKSKDLQELTSLLEAHFGVGRQQMHHALATFKNLFSGSVLGFNPLSTITQVGDLAPLMARYGVRDTVSSLFGRKIVDVYDIGVRELARDTRTPHGTAKFVRTGLQSLGFDKLDKVGGNTAVNAALRNWMQKARKNPEATRKELLKSFTPDEALQLVQDLGARRISPLTKLLVLDDVAGIRPVGREDMPLSYQRNPNGRIAFTLLSWTLKQINMIRNTHINEIKRGNVIKGAKGIAALALFMGVANMPANIIKDIVAGRPVNVEESFVEGMLSLGMTGRYVSEALDRGQGGEALATLVPLLGVTGKAATGLWQGATDGDPVKFMTAVPTGKALYNLFANGFVSDLASAVGAVVVGAARRAVGDGEDDASQFKLPPSGRVGDVQPGDFIKKMENPARLWRNEDGVWQAHKSIEGGTPTLGFGHKVTPQEAKTGKIYVGNQVVKWREGMTDDEVEAIFHQDMRLVGDAVNELVRIPLSPNEYEAISSLIYNVGVQNFAKSNSLKVLNTGDRNKFVRMAFDSQLGFVKVNGKVHPGLVKRRAAEADLFLNLPT